MLTVQYNYARKENRKRLNEAGPKSVRERVCHRIRRNQQSCATYGMSSSSFCSTKHGGLPSWPLRGKENGGQNE